MSWLPDLSIVEGATEWRLRRPEAKLGEIGEQWVSHLLGGKRHVDPFTQTGDMYIDGIECEVKTQNLFRTRRAFTVPLLDSTGNPSTNFNKCMTVPRLFFVEYRVPAQDKCEKYVSAVHDTMTLWECTDRKDGSTFTAGGIRKYGWNVDSMKKLYEENNPELAKIFRKYSSASFSIS